MGSEGIVAEAKRWGGGGSADGAVGLGSELAIVPGIRSGFLRTLGELGVSLPSRNPLSQGRVELSDLPLRKFQAPCVVCSLRNVWPH